MKPRKVVIGVVVLLLLAGAWALTHRDGRSGVVSGTIEADDVRVASRAGGRVANLLVSEGDTVTNGQVLIRLEAAELSARRDYAGALLAELEAGPRTQEVEAARATWQSLEADADFARLDARRKEDLARQKSISETERDNAVARARALDLQVAAAEQRYNELAAGTRPERVAQARARLEEIEADLDEMDVRAPAPCVVETLHVKKGDTVAPNTPLATLIFTGPTWVRVFVPEPWLGRVHVGQAALVRVDPYPGRVFTGNVEQISRQAEFTPRNVQTVDERVKQVFGVKVRLPADEALRAGMAADVRFPKEGR